MRMVIILRDLQGKSYEEVAEILSLPLGTVKSRVNRARIQLAQVLREYRGGTS
jgi:RNA polymerase sigma-70 factor (ECF subfamily)